jgi:hypothetical protein
MPFDQHKNFAYGVVLTAPSPASSGTSLTLQSGQGANFPAASSGDSTTHYNLTIWPEDALPLSSNAEIVRVTNRSGDVFTITRTQEGTSARAIVVGDQVSATITNKTFTDIEGSFTGLLSNINVSAGTTSNNLSRLTFANGNNVSFGLDGSTVTGSVATSLTNIRVSAGTTSNLLSAVTFSNSNGLAFGLDGSTITGSYTVPTVTAGSDTAGISNLGNTAGTSGVISGDQIRFLLAGGNNITLSQSINGASATVTISGANAGGAQTGISGIVASDATYTSGTVTFTGVGGGVTVNSNTGQRVDISVAAQTVQTQNLHNVTLAGNTAGALAHISSGTMTLAGGNNITLSQNGNAVTISGANAGGAQTAISGIVVSDTTYTSGTVSFSNAGNITISSSVNGATQYIRLSGNAAQTAQSAIEGFGVSNTGATAGNTGISTGVDWVLAGSQSITLSQSTAAGTNTVWIQHPAWITTAMQSNAVTLSNIRVSAGTTSNLLSAITFSDSNGLAFGINASTITGSYTVPTVTNSSWTVSDNGTSGTVARLAFTNQNGVTLSLSTGANGSHTIVGSHNALTSQSTQFLALTLGGNTSGTTTFHATNNASLFLNGGNNITLSGNGSTVTISAASQTNQTLGLYAVGNTTGESSSTTRDARTISFVGQGVASVGFSNGSVNISVPAGGGGLTNIRVSAGTTSNLLSAITFADSNGISFGIDASTITASANTVGTATTVTPVASANSVGTVTRWAAEDHRHAGVGGIGISTAGNTSGTTGSVVGTYWIQGGNNITVSQITSNNGSHTLVISGRGSPLSFYDNLGVGATTLSNPGQMTLYVFPYTPNNEVFPENMSANSVFMNVTQSVSTAATWTNQVSIAFYTSVNSTQLTRVFSGSTSWGTNAGNMNINDSFGGTRWLTIDSSNFNVQPVFSAGVRYWCAIWHRTSNNAGSMSLNWYGQQTLGTSGARSGVMGVVSVNNSTQGWQRFLGIYSATFSSAMPAALAASDINKSVAQVLFLPQVILNNVGTNIV